MGALVGSRKVRGRQPRPRGRYIGHTRSLGAAAGGQLSRQPFHQGTDAWAIDAYKVQHALEHERVKGYLRREAVGPRLICGAVQPSGKLLSWAWPAASWPSRYPPGCSSAAAVMSDRPVSLASWLRSLAGAVCAGCRWLPGRGFAAGRSAPGLVMASLTARLCRGHRTAWH